MSRADMSGAGLALVLRDEAEEATLADLEDGPGTEIEPTTESTENTVRVKPEPCP
jgi:hypothetical protein